MRKHKDFIPELVRVIEMDGKIIGCIMYTKAELSDENGNVKPIVSMGPICIHPDYQRMGYDTVINFGNPDNYVARGYKSCKKYNVCFEGDIFPAALLIKVLSDDAFDGRKWFYHSNNADEPCGDIETVAEFDKLFSPKVKAWQPNQEEFYIHSHR